MSTIFPATVGSEFTGQQKLTVVQCVCGVIYAIPTILDDRALEQQGPSGKQIYCPLGHKWHYIGESAAERYKRLYEQESDRRARIAADRDQVQASLSATKGVVTRQKKKLEKVVAGVCPVDGCKRHFKDLRRHISTKHPDYHAQS